MTRINLVDTGRDILVKMADGNPGALSAMIEMLKHGETVDPQCFMGGMGAILSLDTLGIYGTEIYILWNDQCKRDTRELLMLLRANQLGFVSSSEIKTVAEDQMRQVMFSEEKMEELDKQVCERLPRFRKREEATKVGENRDE